MCGQDDRTEAGGVRRGIPQQLRAVARALERIPLGDEQRRPPLGDQIQRLGWRRGRARHLYAHLGQETLKRVDPQWMSVQDDRRSLLPNSPHRKGRLSFS